MGQQQPATYLQQPAFGQMSMPGAEENLVAGAQTFVMPQQASGMQTVESMVMPMPNLPPQQGATDNTPNITPTPAPASEPAGAARPSKTTASQSKKTSSKKGKSSKKKKSGCC